MIKIEELRVGNVIVDYFKPDKLEIRVFDLDDFIAVGNYGNHPYPVIGLKLNTDLILKLNFEVEKPLGFLTGVYFLGDFQLGQNGEDFRNDKYSLRYTQITKNDLSTVVYKSTVEFKVKYVHQLQNIYFALTGEELNFSKIC